MQRYEIKTGKFGQYFHDNKTNTDLPLNVVCALLNRNDAAYEIKKGQDYAREIRDHKNYERA